MPHFIAGGEEATLDWGGGARIEIIMCNKVQLFSK